MGDTFIISGLKEKRSAVAGQIVDMRREIEKLLADLFHIDQVLKIYGIEPDEIPTKGRMPKRSAYFGRNEITRRCYDLLRETGTITADDVSVKALGRSFGPPIRQCRGEPKKSRVSLHR